MFDWVKGFIPWGGSNKTVLTEDDDTVITNTTSTDNGIVNTASALKLSVIWACIGFKANIFASLPCHIRNDDDVVDKEHPLYKLLHRRPNAVQTAYIFRSVISRHMDLYGNAFARIVRNDKGVPVSLEIINPEDVELTRGKYSIHYFVKDVEVSARDILHFIGMTIDGMLGLSPIVYHAETIATSRAVDKAAQTEFKNGLKAGGFVYTGETTLKPEQRTKMRNVLAEFSKPENIGKWMLMEAGMKPEVNDNKKTTFADAQMLEHRTQLIIEICSIFGINPALIGYNLNGNTWGGTLEQLNLQFLQHTLTPILVNIEQEQEAKLLKLAEQDKYSIKHSVDGLLRADAKTRNEIMVQQANNGLRLIDELRALDNMPPLPGGQGSIPVRQVQYQPLGTALTGEGNNDKPIA